MLTLAKKCRPNHNYILSIAHLDYCTDVGGVEKVIGEHSVLINKKGCSYVFLCPVNHIGGQYKLYVDQRYIGVFKIHDICSILKAWDDYVDLLGCHVHHIMFWKEDDLFYLFSSINTEYLFYLHDYYFICDNYNLLKNNDSFCGGGRPSKNKCSGCIHYDDARKRIAFIDKIFEQCQKKKIMFISPSLYVKKLWIDSFPQFENRTFVIEHLKFDGEKKIKQKQGKELRIAFLGSQYDIKGWKEFLTLFNKLHNESNIKFFHLGIPKIPVNGIFNVPVSFHRNGQNSMVTAVENEKIDIAFICPKWPETYNFTCYEAYMGGAFILTNAHSGNVADMVNRLHCGYVLEENQNVEDLIVNGIMNSMLENYRNNSCAVVPIMSTPNDEILNYINYNERGEINANSKICVAESSNGIVINFKLRIKRFLHMGSTQK